MTLKDALYFANVGCIMGKISCVYYVYAIRINPALFWIRFSKSTQITRIQIDFASYSGDSKYHLKNRLELSGTETLQRHPSFPRGYCMILQQCYMYTAFYLNYKKYIKMKIKKMIRCTRMLI